MTSLHRYTLFISLLLAFTCASAQARESNKWRIEFSEGAKSDGDIVFEISPSGASAFEVGTRIEDGTRENRVAQAVSKSLQKQLPDDQYHVEVDDGEDVLVKKRHGAENFGLRLISNTVKAVRIDIERE